MHIDVRNDWLSHVDEVPRALVASNAVANLEALEKSPRHHHEKAQLLFTVRGVINCEVDDAVWIVPPQCAVWIPGGLPHTVFGSGEVECLSLFIDPPESADLPKECCTITVSAFFRHLLLRANELPELYDPDGPDGRIVSVIFDELAVAPIEDLRLPIPSDPRLKKLTDLLIAAPADRATVAQWASRVALSERSLSRLLTEEVGMSFGRWRRQLHIVLALRHLSAGETVQAVAMDLGYESASSFVTMFRKMVGKPPSRYLLERRGPVPADHGE
ncbi:AraC family transcriptional regulator [Altericroceibacterium endophyticum]|uniref:Helix-turn-helix domain-containing protein n=1 Tax=Altericroceibacterium endophyticum TaxID=1808508 RepID=A0A6I4T6A4_9SPHN|nr:helix-turn-helix transcriptional regulator [Altericroceibacterium endophyticum]MXO66436.1 helix-turn-helix domain-containing protein [Altericroceibacterium endophyticum]